MSKTDAEATESVVICPAASAFSACIGQWQPATAGPGAYDTASEGGRPSETMVQSRGSRDVAKYRRRLWYNIIQKIETGIDCRAVSEAAVLRFWYGSGERIENQRKYRKERKIKKRERREGVMKLRSVSVTTDISDWTTTVAPCAHLCWDGRRGCCPPTTPTTGINEEAEPRLSAVDRLAHDPPIRCPSGLC